MRLLGICAVMATFCTFALAQLPYTTTTYLDGFGADTVIGDVKAVGDVNGDGIIDYAIPLHHSNVAPGGIWDEVSVYSGADDSLIHSFTSTVANQNFGVAIAAGGDLNNDGFDDILVGSSWWGTGALVTAGRVISYSGLDGTVIHTVLGLGAGAQFGASIVGLGDIDGDGHGDYLAGAPYFQDASLTQGGYAQVVSGFDGSAIFTFFGPNSSRAGKSIDNIGDINGDGITDFGISEPQFAFPLSTPIGRVRIRSGADGTVIHAIFGTEPIIGGSNWSIRGVDDLDGDGVPDFAIGQPRHVNAAPVTRGRIRIFSGATGIPFRSIKSSVPGTMPGSFNFGAEFESVGDMDGDGVADIASWDGMLPFIRAIVYSGATTANLKTFPPPKDGGIKRISSIGDQNGDNREEIAVISYSALSFTTDLELRIYKSGIKPIEFYHSGSGMAPSLSLNWIPESGHILDSSGRLRISGATPNAQGVVLVSLAPADIPIFGTDLLVAVDQTNLSLIAQLNANAAGVFTIYEVTRRVPALAGTSTYVQVYETTPAIRASQGIRFTAIP